MRKTCLLIAILFVWVFTILPSNAMASSFKEAQTALHKTAFSSSEASRTLRLDVLDVSYLWPQFQEKELLAAEGADPKDDLVPSRELFPQLKKFLNVDLRQQAFNRFTKGSETVGLITDTIHTEDLKNFRVVAFRFDNCGPFAGHTPDQKILQWVLVDDVRTLVKKSVQCLPQLRLVLQPEMYWEDAALHFIYTFTENSLDAKALDPLSLAFGDKTVSQNIIQDLQYLKSVSPFNTSGKPLAPHEGLKDPKFHKEVLKFLKHYVRKEFLTEIAVLSTDAFGGNDAWAFLALDIHPENPSIFQLKPQLSLREANLVHTFGVQKSRQAVMRDEAKLFDTRTVKLEDIFPFSDPRQTSNHSVDCMSCHSETRALSYKAVHQPAELNWLHQAHVDLPSYPGVTGWPDARFIHDAMNGQPENNFRQFGFFEAKPVVTLRTALESARVAASINKQNFGSEKGPGLTCNGPQAKMILCLFSNIGKENACMEQLCQK